MEIYGRGKTRVVSKSQSLTKTLINTELTLDDLIVVHITKLIGVSASLVFDVAVVGVASAMRDFVFLPSARLFQLVNILLGFSRDGYDAIEAHCRFDALWSPKATRRFPYRFGSR